MQLGYMRALTLETACRTREEKLQQFTTYKQIVNLIPGLEDKINRNTGTEAESAEFITIVDKV